ncbi:MAG TPA: hypothetical protein VEY07_04255, partial [Thermoplasmata archaeon]|nr:hypothetical protein [Thermoplasmata archaeon]
MSTRDDARAGSNMKEGSSGSWTWRRIASRIMGPGAFFVVALMLGSGFAAAGTPSATLTAPPPLAVTGGAHATASSPLVDPGAATIHLPGSASSSAGATLSPHPAASTATGRAQFFTTVAMPNPPAITVPTAYSTDTYNATVDPSINLTSQGLMAVAYTAFTTFSPCPAMASNATTEVGFSVSKDLGKTWSKPVYLGNPVCTGYDKNFSSAMHPSLTSLSNGTLVLAYDEYNYTTNRTLYPISYYPTPPDLSCDALPYDRIVVSESYNNGTTWTTPSVLSAVTNNSNNTCPKANYPDIQPWVSANGNSIYVTWMTNFLWGNYGELCPYNYPVYSAPSSSIAFDSSTNGGTSWASVTSLGSYPGSFQ